MILATTAIASCSWIRSYLYTSSVESGCPEKPSASRQAIISRESYGAKILSAASIALRRLWEFLPVLFWRFCTVEVKQVVNSSQRVAVLLIRLDAEKNRVAAWIAFRPILLIEVSCRRTTQSLLPSYSSPWGRLFPGYGFLCFQQRSTRV